MRDLRFAGCGRNLGKKREILSAVLSVHSDTSGFDLVAEVTADVLALGQGRRGCVGLRRGRKRRL